jgi:hypothetical protein
MGSVRCDGSNAARLRVSGGRLQYLRQQIRLRSRMGGQDCVPSYAGFAFGDGLDFDFGFGVGVVPEGATPR